MGRHHDMLFTPGTVDPADFARGLLHRPNRRYIRPQNVRWKFV
jgi:hypothetical protein